MWKIQTYDDHVLADVDVGAGDGGVDDGALADEDVVPDLEGEEGHALAEALEWRPDHGLRADDAVPAHSHVGEVAADDGLALDDVLAVEDDVLGAAEDALSRNAVARSLDIKIKKCKNYSI